MDKEGASTAEPLSGYDVHLTAETDGRYQCPICLLVLREAMQTSCGHRFCRVCINQVVRNNSVIECPVDKQFTRANKIFPDVAIQREIMSLDVLCMNECQDCPWRGELRDLETHRSNCLLEMVTCPHGCNIAVRRSNLEKHVAECPSRNVKCEFCFQDIVYNLMEMHTAECPKYPMTCQKCGQDDLLRENMSTHSDPEVGSCPKVVTPCPFKSVGCVFEAEREEMLQHTTNSMNTQLHLMLISKHLVDMKDMFDEFKETMTQVKAKAVESLTLAIQNEARYVMMSRELISRNTTGRLHWKVNVNGSLRSRVWSVDSPDFYTGNPGYKVRLTMHTDGHREGDVRYVGFTICLLAGEYDDIMLFPFNAVCYVKVYDQMNLRRNHHTTTIVLREVPRNRTAGNSRIYKRGTNQFMKRQDLLTRGSRFLKMGHIYLEICVLHGHYATPDDVQVPNGFSSPLANFYTGHPGSPITPAPPIVSVASFSVGS